MNAGNILAAELLAEHLELSDLYEFCRSEVIPCDTVWNNRLLIDYGVSVADSSQAFEEYKRLSYPDLYQKVKPIFVSDEMKNFVGRESNLWSMPSLILWWTRYIEPMVQDQRLKLDQPAAQLFGLQVNQSVSVDEVFKAINSHIGRTKPKPEWIYLLNLSSDENF